MPVVIGKIHHTAAVGQRGRGPAAVGVCWAVLDGDEAVPVHLARRHVGGSPRRPRQSVTVENDVA